MSASNSMQTGNMSSKSKHYDITFLTPEELNNVFKKVNDSSF